MKASFLDLVRVRSPVFYSLLKSNFLVIGYRFQKLFPICMRIYPFYFDIIRLYLHYNYRFLLERQFIFPISRAFWPLLAFYQWAISIFTMSIFKRYKIESLLYMSKNYRHLFGLLTELFFIIQHKLWL